MRFVEHIEPVSPYRIHRITRVSLCPSVPPHLSGEGKLMLPILAGVATREREIMLERQREGIAKANAASAALSWS